MDKVLLTTSFYFLAIISGITQDSIIPLQLSGSVDVYYKYDLSGIENEDGVGNILTSFAANQNSVSVGMANFIVSQSWDKVGFVADVSFGPRGQSQSILHGDDGNSFHIQNLNVSYAPLDRLILMAGFMGTFIGYEVISPTSNFHYSTSYLFTNGPFQNAGIKASYIINEKITLMAGLFNDWNVYQDKTGMTDFGTQLYYTPGEGYDFYCNFLTGKYSGTTLDLVSSVQLTPGWMTGFNLTHQRGAKVVSDYTGVAIYQEWCISDVFDIGLRGECFKYSDQKSSVGQIDGIRYLSATLSGNIHLGPLTLIPEWRLDLSNAEQFIDDDKAPSKTASQILVAAVYVF